MLTAERKHFRAEICGLVAVVMLSAALAGNEWFEVAPLPGPRAFQMTVFAATDSGPRLYAIGGQRSPSDTMERTCLEYSPQTDSWRQRAAMPQRRGLGQTCVLKDRVWVFGGCRTFGTGLADVATFDPAANAWTAGPNMPQGLYDFGIAVWRDSFAFVLGGGSWHPSMPPTDTVRLFSAATGTWYPATPLPVRLGAMACGIIGDTLLVATGWTDSGPTNRAWRGIISPSNPGVISWQEQDTLPDRRRCRAAGGIANRELYIIGGLVLDAESPPAVHPSSLIPAPDGFSALAEVWSLAGGNQWTPHAEKPHAVSGVFGTGSDASSRIYVAGGYPGSALYLRETECLDVSEYDHDVGVAGIFSPVGRLTPDSTCAVSVKVRNYGAAEENLDVTVSVLDSTTQSLRFRADTSLLLASDSARLVEFGTFTSPGEHVFHTTALVSLAGDQNPTNDTARARSRTTPGSDPDGYGYVYKTTQEPDNLAFSWFDPTGGTLVTDWDPNGDEGTSRRNLPFDFNFYSSTLNRIYVCTNGYLQTSDRTAGLNFPLPYQGITNIIAPFWDDLSVRDSGLVYENFTSDKAVYTWVDARRAQSDTDRLTFQVILQLNGDIRFNYLDVAADATSSTIGIQGGDGSWDWYQEYVYNADPTRHVPTSSTSILFDKPPLGIKDVQNSITFPLELHLPAVSRGPVCITFGGQARALQVFNVSGSLVRVLPIAPSLLSPPSFLVWDRRDQHGRLVPPGAYFIRALCRQGSLTRKLILLD